MKKKQRVPKGRKYCYIDDRLFIRECIETGSPDDDARFDAGNYFHSSHKLSDMALKLEKVLAGADVIEMPSEEDLKSIMPNVFAYGDEFTSGERIGWRNCFDWLKSKCIR